MGNLRYKKSMAYTYNGIESNKGLCGSVEIQTAKFHYFENKNFQRYFNKAFEAFFVLKI